MSRHLINDNMPIEKLAMEYVLLQSDPETRNDWRTWNILQRMQGRCGTDHTKSFIARAQQTLKLIGD